MNVDSNVMPFSAFTWPDTFSLAANLLKLVLGDHPQIVGDHAPADPTRHPLIAVIATAIQPMPPFQPADASFDTCPPIPTAAEPALPLVCQSCWRFAPWSWKNHPRDATLLSHP